MAIKTVSSIGVTPAKVAEMALRNKINAEQYQADRAKALKAEIERVATFPPITGLSHGEPAKRRGRPPSGKVRVHIMLNPATVETYKSTGKGWQEKISKLLDHGAGIIRREQGK